jgi:hypothetical protein
LYIKEKVASHLKMVCHLKPAYNVVNYLVLSLPERVYPGDRKPLAEIVMEGQFKK